MSKLKYYNNEESQYFAHDKQMHQRCAAAVAEEFGLTDLHYPVVFTHERKPYLFKFYHEKTNTLFGLFRDRGALSKIKEYDALAQQEDCPAIVLIVDKQGCGCGECQACRNDDPCEDVCKVSERFHTYTLVGDTLVAPGKLSAPEEEADDFTATRAVYAEA